MAITTYPPQQKVVWGSEQKTNKYVGLPSLLSGDNVEFHILTHSSSSDNLNSDISIECYKRINSAAASANSLSFVEPEELSKRNSWVTTRFFSQKQISPKFVNPIQDGGIMIEYYPNPDLYLMFEFFDDGEIVFMHKTGRDRATQIFKDIRELTPKLQSIVDNVRM